ncbi:12210_t:CDS:2, partial [Cetraspora pellucida]
LHDEEHNELLLDNFIKRHDGGIDFYAYPYAERSLKTLFKSICENVGIEIGDRIILNHSGHKTAVQVLKESRYSNLIVMSIIKYKTQQELYLYEWPKSILQHKGNDNSQQNMNSQKITPNESFSELYDANNISVENSFHSARELL